MAVHTLQDIKIIVEHERITSRGPRSRFKLNRERRVATGRRNVNKADDYMSVDEKMMVRRSQH